jgi:hypothetical protein
MAWMVLKWSIFKIVSSDPDPYWFQRNFFLNIFPIGSYVKTMSADGGHLGWRSRSQDRILKVDHLTTILAMFALKWGENVLKSSPLKPVSQYSKHVIDGP